MANILVDDLPSTITINHTEYQIDPSFRTCLKIILAFEDDELTPQEKQIILLSMLFVKLPADIEQALINANLFLNGGEVTQYDDVPMRLYSFAKDANFIFAAFRQTHGIDLQTVELHWWQFLALFMDLGQDTTFCQLVSLRKRVKTGKATKEERQAAREMGETFNLPEVDDRTIKEKEMADLFERKVAETQRKQNGSV